MAPRRDDEKILAPSAHGGTLTTDTDHSPASRPKLFDLPKDISFLEIQRPSLPVNASIQVCPRMASSLDKATQRADAIHKRMTREDIKERYPFVYEACRSAVVDEMSRVLSQASLLMEDAKKEDAEVSQMTKNKRLSVALIHAIQYLDTLECAMAFSSRDRLEAGVCSVLSMISKCHKDHQDCFESKVCVSSWAAPSLFFDFVTGNPANLSLAQSEHEPLSMPLELQVRPIVEYSAEDLIRAPRLGVEAFAVKVKECSHEQREYGARDGITGVAKVQVHIAPLAESKSKKEVVWGVHNDVEPVRIKEVRATQQNAYPTKFRINFDIFSSTVYGQSGVTLTLNMETCQTMDGKVPKIQIELVVDP
ncbi:expressed unknown protein [Seminavis robusta]|uniref:Uncharacterized protein n=1 Tax=Seminavis robusta TaxID=568900 RepID=A0A9N8H4G8_9STRA|nr:expressed unknown protein [Seminavis robusta]|eukprot:Sro84_g044790.1 n/a (364) ;mRNA; f:54282-55469